ncbi:MAG TPA: IS1595 family transposase [Pyrinomonadaceae bacterium]|nr:IS1595 family transposase [Pyrinomonadaceae bacterium]
MEDSPIGLDKWLAAIWLIANAKNGISSYEISRSLGITQKSAWFLLHRIRLAMQTGTFKKLSGTIEADETVIGGLSRNMHKSARARKVTGTGGASKMLVMGMLERHGEVIAKVVPNTDRASLHKEIRNNIEQGSELFTDAWRAYQGLDGEYFHDFVNHAETYVIMVAFIPTESRISGRF